MNDPYLDAFAFVYVHKKSNETKVLNYQDSMIFGGSFAAIKWHHTATIHPLGWIRYLLESKPAKRTRLIEGLMKHPKEKQSVTKRKTKK